MIACPLCGGKTRVIETRATLTSARRRRRCMTKGCGGKVTTVEVIVSEGGASALAKGSVIVPAKQIAQLREILTLIEGGVL
jgi:transcriptional regulator NrdR family protein